MKTRLRRSAAGVALFPILVLPAAAQERTLGDDRAPVEAAVREVVEGFQAALAAGDSTAALAYLHPELRVFEAGHAETLEEYRSGHLTADIAFLRNVATETLRDAVVPGREMALYLREYAVKGTFRSREIDGRGTETLVLVPTEDGWKIRHIHWSSR